MLQHQKLTKTPITSELKTQLFDSAQIIKKAELAMTQNPPHVTDHIAQYSKGGAHDFYSNGDYWWPNPDTSDGLPFVQRDGQTNPGNFNEHRYALRSMRRSVTHLAAAYKITGDKKYAVKAVQYLTEFFLDEETKMNPHLRYAQAIPGVSDGRGTGIIDSLHLIDVPFAIEAVKDEMSDEVYCGLKSWFKTYMNWMNTHQNGIDERESKNNHSVTWFAQVASYALFTDDADMLAYCRTRYKETLLPNQMAADGSFPHELRRTKPYSYSAFVLDNMINICLLASVDGDSLWDFTLPDGRNIQKGLEFLVPFIQDKSKWPFAKDIQHFDDLPAAMPYLLFAGLKTGDDVMLDLWKRLEQDSANEEIRRNTAIRCPFLLVE